VRTAAVHRVRDDVIGAAGGSEQAAGHHVFHQRHRCECAAEFLGDQAEFDHARAVATGLRRQRHRRHTEC